MKILKVIGRFFQLKGKELWVVGIREWLLAFITLMFAIFFNIYISIKFDFKVCEGLEIFGLIVQAVWILWGVFALIRFLYRNWVKAWREVFNKSNTDDIQHFVGKGSTTSLPIEGVIEFCDDCVHLEGNEEEQKAGKYMNHWCKKKEKHILHLSYHPRLPRPVDCTTYEKRGSDI